MINWNVSKTDAALIRAVVDRAIEKKFSTSHHNLTMTITACHMNGCPLRLIELAKADDFNFAHDILGIIRHIDARTGQLVNFAPRFTR
jgi:hypothetical protein